MDFEVICNLFVNFCENIDWDINGLLLWGYFFVYVSVELLQVLVQYLQVQGYMFVEFFEQELEEGDVLFYVLYVECVEIYDEVLLDCCNQEFVVLVVEYGVEDYDGMDVGLVLVLQ